MTMDNYSMIRFTPYEIKWALHNSAERGSFNEVIFWENLKKAQQALGKEGYNVKGWYN